MRSQWLDMANRGRRKHCLWLLVCTLLLGVLAPLLTQALGRSTGTWVLVCNAQGVQEVRVDDAAPAPSSDQDSATASMGDCPYCRLSTQPAMPPGYVLGSALGLPAASRAPLPAPSHAASREPHWPPGQPRAPPRLLPT